MFGVENMNIRALLGSAFLACAGGAVAQPLPSTPQGNYQLGEQYAKCSATFGLMAVVAQGARLPDTATLAANKARGWKLAGMYFLAEGLDPSRQMETETTFDTLVELELADLKSRYEQDSDVVKTSIPLEFARDCEPLAPMQEKLIEIMRRGPKN
jgi:hypothetical protein